MAEATVHSRLPGLCGRVGCGAKRHPGRAYCLEHGREVGRESKCRVRAMPDGRAASRKASGRYRERHPDLVGERITNWRKEHPERLQEYNRRRAPSDPARHRLYLYGLSPIEFQARLDEQGGLCAICRRQFGSGKATDALHVDHDHVNGKVRGLLCASCNRGLGLIRDEPAIGRAMADYLETWWVRHAEADDG